MAFGGVPIGNMPAQLAPNVMGMPNKSGSIFKARANDVITGAITITWATLLITSLRNIEKVVTTRIIRNTFPVE